jgi:glycogen debranching enzyme
VSQGRDGGSRRGAVRLVLRERRRDAAVRPPRREFLARLWPHVERALEWIDRWGDRDGDGFVEYYRNSPNGLVQQGWKDSGDSIFHADGTLAEGPIALCEVQGYVYAAKLGASAIADWLGRSGRADALRAEAATLKERFDRAFWCEEMRSYALALDGAKTPCRVRASNAGHALWTGVAREDRAAVLARTLFEEDSFSGWGIRTLASGQARYNPMSYHDGSVWPHDNALIAAGLARYGFSSACGRLLTALCEASGEFEFHRVPELFCGFHRRPGQGPTLYPLACSPQAWSAGAAFLMLQACLGITVDGARRRVRFERPLLPHFLDELRLENLGVGGASLDLRIQRNGDDVRVETIRQNGELEILVGR